MSRPVRYGAAAAALALLLAASPAAADAATPSVAQATSGQCTAATRIADAPPAFQILQAERAWALTRGDGVVVAVVDSGVNAANPHLTGAVLKGVNLVDDDADSTGRSDDYGHGTAIAGQIAARGISDSGVIGLAPQVKILPVRVYADVDDQAVKAGTGPDISRLARGIRYAADHGAQIINVSLSTAASDARLVDAVAYAADHGSLVVASAGNRDQTESVASNDRDGARYPAAAAGALGVAAVGVDGVVTSDSIHGPHVSLSAPGQNILSVSPAGGDCIFAADAPATSYATGYVSAAAALVAAQFPDETPAQWAYRLEVTARRANPDARDDVSGWGIVQPYSALTLVPGAGLRGPDSPFVDAQPAAPEASATPVAVHDHPPANAQAWAIASIVAVLALAALGTIGTLAVLRRRKDGTEEPLQGRGLYGDEVTTEE
ncbi:peptidase S8 [Microbacterium protaetiae]|uniref:Peptidase S8 n=1 Tax=Microbacterium protaetiae TaxID=2509458 RepID=A0A4P6EAI7_9MICO|nr:S8 family serine peptidase [Microbacterium protaetiae]QAY59142.1 peptidase S8 [Microbacterium protaetiae]